MNCKPGDLAIVIKSFYGNESIDTETTDQLIEERAS